MGRKLSERPDELFMVRITHDTGGWWEGPYSTQAAAKGRVSYWSGVYYYNYAGRIYKTSVSEWEEIS